MKARTYIISFIISKSRIIYNTISTTPINTTTITSCNVIDESTTNYTTISSNIAPRNSTSISTCGIIDESRTNYNTISTIPDNSTTNISCIVVEVTIL